MQHFSLFGTVWCTSLYALLTVFDAANLSRFLLEARAHLRLGHARGKRLRYIALDGLEEVAELLLFVVDVLARAVSVDGVLHSEFVLFCLGLHACVDLLQHANTY